MTMRYKTWFRIEPDGEDPREFAVMIAASSQEAAMTRARETIGPVAFETWKRFDEVKATWVTIWPDGGREEAVEKMLVTAATE